MANLERVAVACLVTLSLGACAARTPLDGPPRSGAAAPSGLPADPIPHAEARSRYGNGPIYEVYGRRYTVMGSSYGYRAKGLASWYGEKFHGLPTASREPYDMHAMTAAHKSLPLPTYVEVRNLRNNKSVIVRVNDRGPFIGNRIIDLSYSAALKLDIVQEGTSMVEVKAISFDDPPRIERAILPSASVGALPKEFRAAPAVAAVAPPAAKPPPAPRPSGPSMYVQVGAFGDKNNAARRFEMLQDNGISQAFVKEELDRSPALYRVRIGPLADVAQYDKIIEELGRIGIADTHMVTE